MVWRSPFLFENVLLNNDTFHYTKHSIKIKALLKVEKLSVKSLFFYVGYCKNDRFNPVAEIVLYDKGNSLCFKRKK
jgi:hypothetical protein